jgi:hypothetical protein
MIALRALALTLAVLALAACEDEKKAIEQDVSAARATKAKADARQIAEAVELYQAAVGTLPPSLEALTTAQTVGGATSGPFLSSVPAPPTGWTPYRYTKDDQGRFTISTSGGGETVTVP